MVPLRIRGVYIIQGHECLYISNYPVVTRRGCVDGRFKEKRWVILIIVKKIILAYFFKL